MSHNNQAKTRTPKPENSSSDKKGLSKKETQEITPEMLRKAALVLYQGYTLLDEPDTTIADCDLVLDVTISLRVGKNVPVLVEEHRRMQSMLSNPGAASAPEEFEIAMRQILLPLYKEVQRATNACMANSTQLGSPIQGFKITGNLP